MYFEYYFKSIVQSNSASFLWKITCWNPSFTVYWISCVNKLIWVIVLFSIDKTTSTILVHVQKSDPCSAAEYWVGMFSPSNWSPCLGHQSNIHCLQNRQLSGVHMGSVACWSVQHPATIVTKFENRHLSGVNGSRCKLEPMTASSRVSTTLLLYQLLRVVGTLGKPLVA